MEDPQFVLASRSPRRVALLRQLGFRFQQRSADIDESPRKGESPQQLVQRLAAGKAAATADTHLPVLAADTVVALGDEVFGKPADRAQALRMLSRLGGRWHEVYTAVCLRTAGGASATLSRTRVRFGPLGAAQAEAYWATGEPADKAGAYAIQGIGGVFVEALDGSYSGVVGLPLAETAALLAEAGIRAPLLHPQAAA